MSPRAKRKQGSALQVGATAWILAGLLLLSACGSAPTRVHPSSGDRAVTLAHAYEIDVVDLYNNVFLKKIIFGADRVRFDRPVALDVLGDDMIIADAGTGMIYRYDLVKKRMYPVKGAGDQVIGEVSDVEIMPDRTFLVTDTLGKRAIQFTFGGKIKKVFASDPNLSRPIAVSWDEKRKLVLVADELYSHVVAFSPDGEAQFGIGGRGIGEGKFRIITDMLQTADGLYVSDRIELAVQKLKDGRYVEHFGEKEVTFPTAIARDAYGRVFVADKADSRIKVFLDGKMIDLVGRNGGGSGEFRLISDMKIYNDRLYVVDSLNSRIQVFRILKPKDVNAS